jgi:hypothetical protein
MSIPFSFRVLHLFICQLLYNYLYIYGGRQNHNLISHILITFEGDISEGRIVHESLSPIVK